MLSLWLSPSLLLLLLCKYAIAGPLNEFPCITSSMTQIGLVQGQDRFRTAIADAIKTYQNAPTEVWVKADSKDLYSWNEIQQLGGAANRQIDFDLQGLSLLHDGNTLGVELSGPFTATLGFYGGGVSLRVKHFFRITVCHDDHHTLTIPSQHLKFTFTYVWDAEQRLFTTPTFVIDPAAEVFGEAADAVYNDLCHTARSFISLAGLKSKLTNYLQDLFQDMAYSYISAFTINALNSPLPITQEFGNYTANLTLAPLSVSSTPISTAGSVNVAFGCQMTVYRTDDRSQVQLYTPTTPDLQGQPPLEDWVASTDVDSPLIAARASLSMFRAFLWAGYAAGVYNSRTNFTLKDAQLEALLAWDTPTVAMTSFDQFRLRVNNGHVRIRCLSQCAACRYNNVMFDFTFSNVYAVGVLGYTLFNNSDAIYPVISGFDLSNVSVNVSKPSIAPRELLTSLLNETLKRQLSSFNHYFATNPFVLPYSTAQYHFPTPILTTKTLPPPSPPTPPSLLGTSDSPGNMSDYGYMQIMSECSCYTSVRKGRCHFDCDMPAGLRSQYTTSKAAFARRSDEVVSWKEAGDLWYLSLYIADAGSQKHCSLAADTQTLTITSIATTAGTCQQDDNGIFYSLNTTLSGNVHLQYWCQGNCTDCGLDWSYQLPYDSCKLVTFNFSPSSTSAPSTTRSETPWRPPTARAFSHEEVARTTYPVDATLTPLLTTPFASAGSQVTVGLELQPTLCAGMQPTALAATSTVLAITQLVVLLYSAPVETSVDAVCHASAGVIDVQMKVVTLDACKQDQALFLSWHQVSLLNATTAQLQYWCDPTCSACSQNINVSLETCLSGIAGVDNSSRLQLSHSIPQGCFQVDTKGAKPDLMHIWLGLGISAGLLALIMAAIVYKQAILRVLQHGFLCDDSSLRAWLSTCWEATWNWMNRVAMAVRRRLAVPAPKNRQQLTYMALAAVACLAVVIVTTQFGVFHGRPAHYRKALDLDPTMVKLEHLQAIFDWWGTVFVLACSMLLVVAVFAIVSVLWQRRRQIVVSRTGFSVNEESGYNTSEPAIADLNYGWTVWTVHPIIVVSLLSLLLLMLPLLPPFGTATAIVIPSDLSSAAAAIYKEAVSAQVYLIQGLITSTQNMLATYFNLSICLGLQCALCFMSFKTDYERIAARSLVITCLGPLLLGACFGAIFVFHILHGPIALAYTGLFSVILILSIVTPSVCFPHRPRAARTLICVQASSTAVLLALNATQVITAEWVFFSVVCLLLTLASWALGTFLIRKAIELIDSCAATEDKGSGSGLVPMTPSWILLLFLALYIASTAFFLQQDNQHVESAIGWSFLLLLCVGLVATTIYTSWFSRPSNNAVPESERTTIMASFIHATWSGLTTTFPTPVPTLSAYLVEKIAGKRWFREIAIGLLIPPLVLLEMGVAMCVRLVLLWPITLLVWIWHAEQLARGRINLFVSTAEKQALLGGDALENRTARSSSAWAVPWKMQSESYANAQAQRQGLSRAWIFVGLVLTLPSLLMALIWNVLQVSVFVFAGMVWGLKGLEEWQRSSNSDQPALRMLGVRTFTFIATWCLIVGLVYEAIEGEVWNLVYTRRTVLSILSDQGLTVDKGWDGLTAAEDAWSRHMNAAWCLNVLTLICCVVSLLAEFRARYRLADWFVAAGMIASVIGDALPATINFASLLGLTDLVQQEHCAPQYNELIDAIFDASFGQIAQLLVVGKLGPLLLASAMGIMRAGYVCAVVDEHGANASVSPQLLSNIRNWGVVVYRVFPILNILMSSTMFLTLSTFATADIMKIIVATFWFAPSITAQFYQGGHGVSSYLNYIITVWVLFTGSLLGLVVYFLSLYGDVWSLLQTLLQSPGTYIYITMEFSNVLIGLRAIGQFVINGFFHAALLRDAESKQLVI